MTKMKHVYWIYPVERSKFVARSYDGNGVEWSHFGPLYFNDLMAELAFHARPGVTGHIDTIRIVDAEPSVEERADPKKPRYVPAPLLDLLCVETMDVPMHPHHVAPFDPLNPRQPGESDADFALRQVLVGQTSG